MHFVVCKTFKGMTDAVLTWQTERFLELETHRVVLPRRCEGSWAARSPRIPEHDDSGHRSGAHDLRGVAMITGTVATIAWTMTIAVLRGLDTAETRLAERFTRTP
ncbi:hypothetical protein [Nocardioides sp.]|uniref:hypothetical protein n=1 Tax=Nocardioides sp. TaxID=35761 RepID=UPI00286A8D5D|nr:hypothetical protein [Nocardioides sp.]